jgi:hypothetical protein
VDHPLYLPRVQGANGDSEEQKGDVMVKVDFDNATLDQILLSICRQAGVVYDAPNGGGVLYEGWPIPLRVGDPQVDLRPKVNVGDYTLHVTNIRRETNSSKWFRWGGPLPDKADSQGGILLGLQINSRTLDAARKLAGVSPYYASPPNPPPGPVGRGPYLAAVWPGVGGVTREMSIGISYPAPPPETRMGHFEGDLVLFSALKVTELKITPDAVGQTFTQDDISMTEKTWKMDGQQLTLELEGKRPSLPGVITNNMYYQRRATQTAVLVAKDGRELPARGNNGQWATDDGGATMSVNFSFDIPQAAPQPPRAAGPVDAERPFVIDYARVTFVRTGDADATLPFVLDNVPLP